MSFDTTELDKIICGRGPHIYAFTTETVPNYLKVGDTYRPVERRLDEWRRCFPDLDKKFEGSARVEGESEYFRDYSVHRFLEQKRGRARLTPKELDRIKKKEDAYYSPEFFKEGTAEDVADAIRDINGHYKALKAGTESPSDAYIYYSHKGVPHSEGDFVEATCDYEPRENQREVIENFKKAVASGRKNLLMYAVMRFGKSFTSMCCAQEMDAKLVVIVSAKADVMYEWRDTILSHKKLSYNSNPDGGYCFLTKEDLDRNDKLIEGLLAHGKRAVVFLTLQYLQGDDAKKRNGQIFDNKIDLLIVDETHFGARGEKLGTVLYGDGTVVSTVASEANEDEEADRDDDEVVETEAADEAIEVLDRDITLHLSGTPYRILMNDNEFKKEDIIAFVQYSDILKAQEDWDKKNIADVEDENKKAHAWDNPYYGFPQMIRFAFNLNESSRKMLEKLREKNKSADLSTLLAPKSTKKAEDGSHRKFKHQMEVLDLLKVLDGTESDDELMSFLDYDGFKTGQMCRHVVMVLPYKASCDAMEKLISDNKRKFHNLCDYEILNIAGFECPDKYATVSGVKGAIHDFETKNQKTITLTVIRMLTGSTVEEWDTMLFLRGTKSPQDYDQATFRLQNKYVKHTEEALDEGASGAIDNEQEKKSEEIWLNMKPQTLLVDFDPTRMFVMQERRAQIYNLQKGVAGNDQLIDPIKRELEVSPIISTNAGKLTRINASNVMEAVSNYNNDRGIKEEALDVSVDLGLLEDPEIYETIKNEGEIGKKGSLRVNPTADRPEGLQSDVEIGDNQDGGNEEPGNGDADGANVGASKDERLSLVRKVQNYYARILLFSFITESRVVSLKDIIDSFDDNSENTRIKKNLGLDERTVSQIYDYYYKNNKTILSELDYKIMDLNALSHSGIDPDEKVRIALKKFGKLDDAIVVTPADICYEMIRRIPEDDFVETIKNGGRILDPVSTAGEFAVAICKRVSELSDDVKRSIPDDTLKNCFYAIPKSSVCYELTRKTYKMLNWDVNNIAVEFSSFDLIDLHKLEIVQEGVRITSKSKKKKNETKRLDLLKNLGTQNIEFSKITLNDLKYNGGNEVGFDIIVGNPPYQVMDGGAQASATPIYQQFVDMARNLSLKVATMIIPARWMSGGKGLDDFRASMLDDDEIRELHDFEKSADCFKGVEIKGGVCYFLWEKDSHGLCRVVSHKGDGTIVEKMRPLKANGADVFIRYSESISILEKVQQAKECSFSKLVSSRNPFGIGTKFRSFDSKEAIDGYIKIYCKDDEGYIKPERIVKGRDKFGDNKWKVYISKAYGAGDDFPHQIINRPFVGEPNTVCTETYLVIGPFATEVEAENVVSYMKTKFFRFMVLLKKSTQNTTEKVYQFAPKQDFSKTWTDEELYKKYDIQGEEREFIDRMIRPLN